MTAFVAMLRAVNVGGTRKLPMKTLVDLCEHVGFVGVRTFIASGNAVFESPLAETRVKAALESELEACFGVPIPVAIRDGSALATILRDNPFPDAPRNWVTTIFLDRPPTEATLAGITGQAADEQIVLGSREIFVRYGSGIGRSKLRIPVAATSTARNMNTVAELAGMVAKRDRTE